MNSDPGPIIRDQDYTSPTYGQFVSNPAYTGPAVTGPDGTVYGGDSRVVRNENVYPEGGDSNIGDISGGLDLSYGSAGPESRPSSGGGFVAPSGMSALTTGTLTAPSSSSPAGAFGAQNQITGNTSSTGNGGYMSRYGNTDFNSEAERYLSTFQAPRSEEEIYAEKTRQAQSRIDALNKYYESVLLDTARENEARSAEQNALSVMAGLAGSSEASQYRMRTENINTQANAKVQAQKNLELQNIYKEIQADAYKQFQDERTNARQSALDVVARNDAQRTRALENISVLAANPQFDLDKIKQSDPRTYDYYVRMAGGEAELKARIFAGRPQNKLIGNPQIFGNMMMQTIQKPDGTIFNEAIPLPAGIDATKVQSIQKDDTGIYMIMTDGSYKRIAGSGKATIADVGTGYVKGQNPTIDSFAEQINLGKMKMSDVPAKYKAGVAVALNAMNNGKITPIVNNLVEAKKIVQELLTHPGRAMATGGSSVLVNPFSLQANDFRAKVDRLNSLLFLNAVPQMKGMGQLTEREGAKLEQSSSVTKAFNVPESKYKDELDRLMVSLGESLDALGADPATQNMSGMDMTGSVFDQNQQYNTEGVSQILISPDGQPMDASALTPQELQEAINSGYQLVE